MSLRSATKREGPLDQFLFLAISVLLGAGLLLWLTGEVAGYLHSGTWPRVTAADMGSVMVNVAKRPAAPATAWPQGARELLPGPFAFYAIFAILLLLVTAVFLLARTGWRGLRQRMGSVVPRTMATASEQPGPAGWGRPQAFARLYVRGPEPGRLTLGRLNGRLVASESLQSVIALGPPGSHKTAGLTLPAILEWEGPVLVATTKPDLIHQTMQQRWQAGEVYLYDPAGVTGLEQSGWSPLGRCTSWQASYRTALSLLGAGRTTGASGADADFLQNAAPTLLAPLLLAASISGRTIADVVRWVQRQERGEVTAALNVAGEPAATDAIQSIWGLGEQRRGQVYATVLAVIAACTDPAVRRLTPATQLTAQRLLDGHANTAYVCAPAHEQRRLGPLFVTLVEEVIEVVQERAAASGQPAAPPLLVVLDDAATSAPLPQLDVHADTADKHGVQLLTTFRDLAQISTRYGERAEAVLSSHRAKVFLSGITDPSTRALLAHLLKDESVREEPPPSRDTEGPGGRHPTPSEALRRIFPGQGVLLYSHLPPGYLVLRPWFRDRHLSAKVSAPGTTATMSE